MKRKKQAIDKLSWDEVELIPCHVDCKRTGCFSVLHHIDCLYKKTLYKWIYEILVPDNVPLLKDGPIIKKSKINKKPKK